MLLSRELVVQWCDRYECKTRSLPRLVGDEGDRANVVALQSEWSTADVVWKSWLCTVLPG